MVIIRTGEELSKWLDSQPKTNKTLGFVPTMGALHAGHISLVNASRAECQITVCSIFVNPTQFNDPSDLAKYPVTIEADIDRLEGAGCDLLFLPSVQDIYPNGMSDLEHYDLGELESKLEGGFRPGHFQGVCQVVKRLLDLVRPDKLFLGQKDYQQCMVIARLAELMNSHVEIRVCPTLREVDGLAMSSRNLRLGTEDRIKAVTLSKALKMIKDNIRPGNISDLVSAAAFILAEEGFRVEYVSVADRWTLDPVDHWNGEQELVVLAAAWLNNVRLIDNMLL